MIRIFKLNDVDALAKELSTRISHPIVLFDGSMGMGKTTLIKALCKQLNVVDYTPSYGEIVKKKVPLIILHLMVKLSKKGVPFQSR